MMQAGYLRALSSEQQLEIDLVGKSCSAGIEDSSGSVYTDFYVKIREMQNHARQNPPYPNSEILTQCRLVADCA